MLYGRFQENRKFPGVSKNFVPGTGHYGSKLFLIGEAPGQKEDETRLPFQGTSGEILTSLLQGIGLTREHCFITNLFKYRPPDNRNPSPGEINASVPLLVGEIKIIRPRIIVPMGAIATSVFTGDKLDKSAGIIKRWGPYKLIPTWHPARAAYQEDVYLPVLKSHFEIIKEALNAR